MKVRELGHFIRDQRRTARLSLRKLSSLAGVSNPYLSQIERGLRRPSAEILQAIAKALRISAETLYVKAGILEERDGAVDLIDDILRDESINEKQKQILIEVYNSFKRDDVDARSAPRAKRAAPRKKAAAKPAAKTAARAKKGARKAPARRPAAKPKTQARRPLRSSA